MLSNISCKYLLGKVKKRLVFRFYRNDLTDFNRISTKTDTLAAGFLFLEGPLRHTHNRRNLRYSSTEPTKTPTRAETRCELDRAMQQFSGLMEPNPVAEKAAPSTGTGWTRRARMQESETNAPGNVHSSRQRQRQRHVLSVIFRSLEPCT
jgi:hypothetical protein